MKRVSWLSIFLFLYVAPTFAKPAPTKDFPELLSSRQLLALTPARRMAYFIKVRQMMLELSAMSAKGKGSLVAIQDTDPSRWESLMNVLVPAAGAAQCNDPAYPFDLGSVCGVPCGGRDKYGHERSQAVGGVYFCFSESEYRSAGANPVLTLKQKLDTRGTWAEVKPRLDAATEQAAAKIRQRNDPLASIGSGRVGPDGRPIGESKAGADNGPAGTNVTANNRKTQQEQSTALTVGTPPLAPWEKAGEAGAVGGPSGVASTNPGKSCSRAGDVYSKFSDACVAEETYKEQMVAYNKEKDEAITADKIVATSTPESPACKASTVNCSDKDKYRKSEREKALEEFRKDAPNSCVYAGNMSTYANKKVEANNCSKVSEFCISKSKEACDKPTPAGYGNDFQLKYNCDKGKTLCSPFIFGLERPNKALCVPARGKFVTEACDQAARKAEGAASGYVKDFLGRAPTGVAEAWDEYAEAFNKTCRDNTKAMAAHCEECNIIGQRLKEANLVATGSCGAAVKYHERSGKPGDSTTTK